MNFSSILEYDELANFSLISTSHKIQNLNAIAIHDYGRYFLLEPNFRLTKIPSRLWVDKTTGQIIEKDFNESAYLIMKTLKTKKGFSAFLGFINLFNQHFLIMVDQAILNCQLEGHDIYQICSIEFVPFEEEKKLKESLEWKDINKNIEIIKNLLSFGFYFSFSYDITLSKDKIQRGITEHEVKFWWNQNLLKDLISQNISKCWQLAMIQGFIKNFAVYLMGKKLEFYLISRKSCKKAGTRYNARGIDDEGYVANFVETEQIIFYSFYMCSFVQTRGSVPFFWEQTGLTAAVRLTRSLDLAKDAFQKHFEDLHKDYKRVLCINLMNTKKKSENLLTENYELLIKESKLNFIKYEYFDFHYACKGQKYENVDFLIEKLERDIENFKFYAIKIKPDGKTLLFQQGVVRVNCLDCLDRTNLVMTKIAALMLQNIMKHMNTDLCSALGEDFIKLLDIPISQTKKFHPFVYYFKNAWADNGDYLSVHYAGTGSTTSTITRTSKVGFLNMLDHGMKSIGRFFINNFEDHIKQEAIDIILGQKIGDFYMSKYEETLESQLMEKRHEYIAYSKIKVCVCTWNVNNFKPTNEKFDLSMLNFEKDKIPDIFVIGLQEIDGSTFNNLLSNDNEKTEALWQNIIKYNVSKLDNYYEISHLNFYGCFLIILAKSYLRDRIKKIQFDEVNFSAITNFSKKGSLLIKFHIEDSSCCFINCHFEAGANKIKERIQNLNTIHTTAFNQELENFEYKFLFGDLNFRILNVNDQEIRKRLIHYQNLIDIKEFEQAQLVLRDLQNNDEIWEIKKHCKYLDKYQENEIYFLPTYKYDLNSKSYEIKKTPAWCDRIMVWTDEDSHINQISYERKEVLISQHRPVLAIYEIETKAIDQIKKGKIIQDYIVTIEKEQKIE